MLHSYRKLGFAVRLFVFSQFIQRVVRTQLNSLR